MSDTDDKLFDIFYTRFKNGKPGKCKRYSAIEADDVEEAKKVVEQLRAQNGVRDGKRFWYARAI